MPVRLRLGSLILALAPLGLAAVACASAKSGNQDLIFLGTVTGIEIADTGDPLRQWVVTTKVDQVLSGHFSATRFEFPIHSPAQSGLEVGKQYKIRATRVPEGYVVDEYQWLPQVPAPGRSERSLFISRLGQGLRRGLPMASVSCYKCMQEFF